MLSVILLSAIMLKSCYVKRHCIGYCCVECYYIRCHCGLKRREINHYYAFDPITHGEGVEADGELEE